jgi:hypothetical protein
VLALAQQDRTADEFGITFAFSLTSADCSAVPDICDVSEHFRLLIEDKWFIPRAIFLFSELKEKSSEKRLKDLHTERRS